ncbi:glycosyltransferase [Sphaerochaeta pleomorpha str. Grapes]|uniref:Glycosyltransferase n=1 Tax=Sphaerochaeta pleomorpha (strain ATCC BAA-1885 / DSM 22778 / Grapes) TaxID=158190 RepID=G8QY67_SPHPG|nr:glycosyltransferase family 4 protein [Sphaerochaeta pleomorpha]AEV29632.1 glycosyltransferase [Sphaerochaeta pleomorpha str. Grapes]
MSEGGKEPLRIGMLHFEIFGTDGVSLEMEKWKQVLENAGHSVFLCSGEKSPYSSFSNITIIEELSYHLPLSRDLDKATFHSLLPFGDEAKYREALFQSAEGIKGKLDEWIENNLLDVIIVENVWSVGLHPAAAIALSLAIQGHHLSILSHEHDFYWERVIGLGMTCKTAMEIVDCFIPPHTKGYSHVVINRLTCDVLAKRKGIEAAVIPNVFDFYQAPWVVDDFNADFRQSFGINPNDIVILQATRIIPRKGIELAIDVVACLATKKKEFIGRRLYNGKRFSQKSRIVLLLAGDLKDDQYFYFSRLVEKAKQMGVEMIHIGDRISSRRHQINNRKTYSLWDSYVHADLVSYPSYWEGWGNQFLEAVQAKLPIVLFEYPVYKKDIRPQGFLTISLGDTVEFSPADGLASVKISRLKRASKQMAEVLFDRKYRTHMVEMNFEIAQRQFSLEALRRFLEPYLELWSNEKKGSGPNAIP